MKTRYNGYITCRLIFTECPSNNQSATMLWYYV